MSQNQQLSASNMILDVLDALDLVLADMFALYVKTKNSHWHVSGPHFRDYHLLLDDQASQIFATTDVIAEWVRKLGRQTLKSIGQIAVHQRHYHSESARELDRRGRRSCLVPVRGPANGLAPWDWQ